MNPGPSTAAAAIAATADATFGAHSICNTLAHTDATLERFAWLGDQLAAAIWTRNAEEAETAYDQPGHHTLSCYLNGGYRTERAKLPGVFGGPARLCTLPDDHQSRWWVRGPMHFIHLYFLPAHFTQRAIRELDREPRELTLADRTYFEDARLANLCLSLANDAWSDADGRLRANETAHEALTQLLRVQGVNRAGVALKGGLSSATRRRLRDYIDAHLTQALTLGDLAQVANLSEYHLSRMFRLSFGKPPHAWIAQQRVERARALLRHTGLPLAEVAAQCGYANPSHFSHRFREAVGAAPIVYREALRGASRTPA
ncbi:AraC family transcriptional regulator [Paraburkholderia jirisanensis]